MKNFLFGIGVFSLSFTACSKKEPVDLYPVDSPKAPYDTIAKDSFANGSTSIDIVRQIRMSSQKYQDSIKQALKVQAEEKRIQAELEKENKKKAEEEKKKLEEEKRRQKAAETSAGTETTN
ncbi:hypothetical protein VUJ46_15310 [Chryseobacterium sp. MYb264]|uniref:hypothetical protein n=1 Tax=Chryseobacterium sp. MYb264 TaxID=2745153 RepID=UPI002E13D93E|nr:hypothetical protein VUJ46_15310 [Chryseobacterium sp. MYb264]